MRVRLSFRCVRRVRVRRPAGWRVAGLWLFALVARACAVATPTPEPVAIRFAFHEADLRHYEGALAGFADLHPEVGVELAPLDWNQLGAVDGDAADSFAASAGLLNALYQSGDLIALDPFLEHGGSLATDDFYPGLMSALTQEGSVWGLPAGVDVYVMYINEELFEQFGVSYPGPEWSWAEFLDRALATRDDDLRVYGYTTTRGYWDAVLFIYENGGRIVDAEREASRLLLDDPETVEALEWYADLFHEHDVAPTIVESRAAFGGGNYAFYQGIRSGRVAMWILPLSQRGGMMWPVEWLSAWRAVPLPRGRIAASGGQIDAYAISANASNRDACWLWITYLTHQMTQRLVPPRRSLVGSEAFDRVFGEETAEAARISLETAVVFPADLATQLGPGLDVLEEALAQIIAGEMSPVEAVDWAMLHAGG